MNDKELSVPVIKSATGTPKTTKGGAGAGANMGVSQRRITQDEIGAGSIDVNDVELNMEGKGGENKLPFEINNEGGLLLDNTKSNNNERKSLNMSIESGP